MKNYSRSRKWLIISLTVALFACTSSASGQEKTVVIPLLTGQNKAFPATTGISTCYDVSGAVLSCQGTGQDGEYQKGISSPAPRFIDNGDGTVTDLLTDLMWLKDANCMGNHYADTDFDGSQDGWVFWESALTFIAGINSHQYPLCGGKYDDWRLPNIKELLSLVDYSNLVPALPSNHPFTSVEFFYWSSTYYAGAGEPILSAWYIDLRDGSIVGDSGVKTTEDYPVWPVRAGR